MTRRIAFLVAATTSAVVLAFIVPLCFLVANLATDRATTRAREQAQSVATLVASLEDRETLARTVADAGIRGPEVIVVEADGTVLGRDGVPTADTLDRDTWAAVARAREEQGAFTIDQDHGLDAVVPVATSRGLEVVVATVPAEELREGVLGAWVTISVLGLGLVALSVAAAFRLGRRTSEPVVEVARVAHRLREGDSTARAVPGGPPETAELGRALNALADRIHELVTAERENVADLGHRLRTPVTALRLDTDLVTDEELAGRLRAHVDELQRSIDDVVRDARRAVRDELPRSSELPAVVAARVAFWSPLAEDQGRRMTVAVDDGAVTDPRTAATVTVRTPVGLPAEDVREIVDILLDNVFAHTPEGAEVRVTIRPVIIDVSGGVDSPAGVEGAAGVEEARQAGLSLTVADAGPGLHQPYRGRGHSDAGSTGLGLAIVHRLAEGVGGSVSLDRSDLGGLDVTVTLPAQEGSSVDSESRSRS
ncbi:HAMP domain-containing protein [Nostocoides sp. F2B08]|uniref:sensor histidine kinase n=1 Tax=Nostocoides sp. F2B08 TaxID=2653936 RepID=UPI00126333AF|nr:HAMP domain-containing sensor histidine kinase [Tetrasphaera sp. F2B08]KAB7743962.1 HAMP domain-containing protein [Tetrasphaera sp. F2B08]